MDAPVPATVELPAPTPWPLVLAFGVTLSFAGLVTTAAVSIAGLLSAAAGIVGWIRAVLPHEAHVSVPVEGEAPAPVTKRRDVARVHVTQGLQRAWLPIEIYPVSAGVKGGLAGSVAMALVAMMYGLFSGTGVWYPINLLAGGFLPNVMHMTTSELTAFHLRALLTAAAMHLLTSLLVGLLYGAMLPVLARRPMLFGGLVAPILWSGLLQGVLKAVDPLLQRRVDWIWFIASQIAFGLVAGFVVSRQERVRTWQAAPLAARLGVETPGLMVEHNEEKGP